MIPTKVRGQESCAQPQDGESQWSTLQPCLWTQPQVQACLLGEGALTFLSPKHFSLRPTQSIQHCHPILPPNSQLPPKAQPSFQHQILGPFSLSWEPWPLGLSDPHS